MTDRDLLQRYLISRDQAAFAELVNRHIHLVYGVARRQFPADADDITQAVFLLLSQKAHRLTRETSLSGWLFRAARFCALNAKKAQRRRRYHEQKAGGIMSTPTNLDTETLDHALAALPRDYREAVLLRYLEGRSIEDTSTALGISPAAAGKRATRGLEMLRAHYAMQGSAVAGLLTVEAAKLAPTHLASAVSATIAHGSAATKAVLLAKMTAKSLFGLSTKLAVAASAIITVTVVTAASIALTHTAAPPPPPGTAPAAAPRFVAPAPTTPVARLAAYSLLVDAATADEVRKLTTPTDGKATFYELRRGKSDELGAKLRSLSAGGAMVYPAQNIMRNFEVPANPTMYSWAPDIFPISFGELPQAPGPGDMLLQLQDPLKQATLRDGGVHLKIDFDNRAAVLTPYDRLRPPPLEKAASVHYESSLASGDALVMLGDFGNIGRHVVALTIYENYAADISESGYLEHFTDTAQWLNGGAAEARRMADLAMVWGYGHQPPRAVALEAQRKWTRVLSDGTKVTLERVGRPAKWPCCWWDADGQPSVSEGFGGGMERGELAVVMRVESPEALSGRVDVPMEDRLFDERAFVVEPGRKLATMYVAVKPWKEQPIALKERATVGEGFVTLAKVSSAGNACYASLRGRMGPATQVALCAVTKDGKRVISDDQRRERLRFVGGEEGKWTESMPIIMTPLETVDHWLLLTREREEAVFADYAEDPVTAPGEEPSAEEMASAQKEASWRRMYREGLHEEDELVKVDAIARDEGTPEGALRILVDKALAGDIAGVKGMFVGKDAWLLDASARYFAAMGLMEKKANDRFKRVVMSQAFAEHAVRVSLAQQFLSGKMKVTGEEARDETGHVVMVRREGKWRVDVDRTAGSNGREHVEKELARVETGSREVVKSLESGEVKDAGEAAERIAAVVFGRAAPTTRDAAAK